MVLLQISFRRKQKLVAKMKYYLSAICFIPEEDVQYDSLSNHCLLRVIMTSGGIHTSQKIAKYCSQIACQELKKGITSLHHAEKKFSHTSKMPTA